MTNINGGRIGLLKPASTIQDEDLFLVEQIEGTRVVTKKELLKPLEDKLDNITNKENWVSVLDFGAKCDGTTDDSEAFQKAINTINTHTTIGGQWKRVIYIPAKMRITKKINIPFGQFKLKGNSLNNSQILCDGQECYLDFYNTSNRHEIEIQDIWIKGNGTNNKLIQMNKTINIYFTRVNISDHGTDRYAIEFTDCGIYFFEKCIIQGGTSLIDGGTRRGIKEIQTSKGTGSIISFAGCNIWNLKEFINMNGNIQKLNIYDNWIECVKTMITINSAEDMRYSNISIFENFINNHNEGGFIISEFAFIDTVTSITADWFGALISVNNNTLYLWDLVSIKDNSLINFNTIKPNTELSINYNTNTFSGKRLDQLNAYMFNTKNNVNFISSVFIRNVSTCLRIDTTTLTDRLELITDSINLPNKKFGSPNGFYFHNASQLNDGNIFYENGAFYTGVDGTIKAMPKKSNYSLSKVDTTSVNTQSLGVIVNGIIEALVQAQIINLGKEQINS